MKERDPFSRRFAIWLLVIAVSATGCARKVGYGKDDVARQVGYLRQDVQALQEQCAALKEQQKALASEVRSLGGGAQASPSPAIAPPPPAPPVPAIAPAVPVQPAAPPAAPSPQPAAPPAAPSPQPAAPPTPSPPEQASAAEAPPAPGPEPSLRPDETLPAPNDLYKEAFDSMRSGEITKAEVLFSEFVRVYPEHDLADNAQYWLGECFYGQKEYDHALNLFRHLVDRFPEGNKVPDALYKQALCEKILGKSEEAAQTAKLLVNKFPTTEAAQKARNLFK